MTDTYKVIQADRDAAEAEKLGKRYREIQAGEFACSEIVCTFPHDGNCWCFNTALAKHREDTEALIVGWRPIETAPKDFTPVLAHAIGADGRPMIAIVRWADTETMFSSSIPRMNFSAATCAWVGEMGTRYGVPFTHWMPLPPSPGDHHTNNTPGD